MPKGLRNALLTLLVVFLTASPLWAQATSSLTGTVTDPTGAVIPGAEVKLTNQATGATRSTTTGANGVYIFPQLAPASYKVEVSAQGFKTAVFDRVVVQVGLTATLDVELEVGAIAEVVEVEAVFTPAINTADASVGNPFSELQIIQLPAQARNPVGILALQPGVVNSGGTNFDNLLMGSAIGLDSRDGVVNGVRANQSNVTLDGADVNDQQNQTAFMSVVAPSLDSLQEFRVTTTNASASEGTAGGAQVAMITRRGEIDWHGNARYFHRNTKTAANRFFNNALGRDPVTGEKIADTPKLLRHLGGASFGGPIIPDRVFFFLDYELRRDSRELSAVRIVPTEPFKQGFLTYDCEEIESPPGSGNFIPNPVCAATNNTFTLNPTQLAAIDPRAQDGSPFCDPASVTGCGVNPFMLTYWSQFSAGNDPTQGLDAGLNFIGFRFNAPIETNNNLYTARFDLNLDADAKHTVYLVGRLNDIKTDILPAHFPGRPPASVLLNNGKLFIARYGAQFSPTVFNTFRYSYTRAGIERTGVGGDEFSVRSFSANTNFNRAFGRAVPVHQFRDDLTWIRGNHTFRFGGVFRRIRNDRFSNAISFPDYLANNGFCLILCTEAFANVTTILGAPEPDSDNAFTRAYMGLTGSITQAEASFFVDAKTQTFLPAGTPQARIFAENHFEWYVEDKWRLKPNLTLTLGLRHSYFSPIWETRGAMVRPTVDFQQWWNNRTADFLSGIPADAQPLLEFTLAGKANNAPAWWDPDKNNFAPRVALAWSPEFQGGFLGRLFGGPGKTSIRAGAGIFYSRFGGALAIDTDLSGSPGLANALINAASLFGLSDAPRFAGSCDASGCSGLPAITNYVTPPTSATFPATPLPGGADGLGFMVDNNLITPYSMNFSFSIQREVSRGVTLDFGYVGVLGRQLLGKIDMAMIGGILTDPASGQTLWGAYNYILDFMGPDVLNPAIDSLIFDPTGAIVGANAAALAAVTPTDPFIEIMMINMPATAADFFCFVFDNPTQPCFDSFLALTPTQAFYPFAQIFAPTWVDPLFFVFDVLPFVSPWSTAVDPTGDGLAIVQPQFQALPGWVNWGSSNYHSFQLSVRKNVGSVQFHANYVLSKSIDNGSSAENAPGIFGGFIQNAFASKAGRARSDFDLRHNFNANWVIQLPFGRGHTLGADVPGWLNHIIGDWQFSGAWLWRSGFPVDASPDFAFPTSFFISPPVTATQPVSSSLTKNDANGVPNLFSDSEAVRTSFTFTAPGDVGSRNIVNGPAFFGVDFGVAKRWLLPWAEGHSLQFRWELFNAFNNTNFNDGFGIVGVPGVDLLIDFAATFGRLRATNAPREMQFALRYEF